MGNAAASMTGNICSAWMDGRRIDPGKDRISLLTHSLHYGTAVFDACRSRDAGNGRIAMFRLMDHVGRLFKSAESMGITLAHSQQEVVEATRMLVADCGLKETYIRLLVFLGNGIGLANDVPAHLAVLVVPWASRPCNGLHLCIPRVRRPHPDSTVITAKSAAHYANSRLAALEAKQRGFNDALQLDHNELVAETTVANIFMVNGDALFTPAPGMILPGFTRDTVMAIARMEGIRYEERLVSTDDIRRADEVFVAGTASEITSVTCIDGTVFRHNPGPVTRLISERYQEVVCGKDERFRNWITWA